MSDKLPELIDPLLCAERRTLLAGALPLAAFGRLSDQLADQAGQVEIDLRFAKEGKQAVANGHVKTELHLVCQSCLQTVAWPIDLRFKLGVVASLAQADRLEIDCEPLLFNGEKLSLIELIEDEILLTLPDYPRHDDDCIKQSSSQDADFEPSDQAPANNPFSVLAKLKKTGE